MIKPKKIYYFLPLIIITVASYVLFGSLLSYKNEGSKKNNVKKEVLSVRNEADNKIEISINFGDEIFTTQIPFEENLTVLGVLENAAKEKALDLKTTKYDFGIMIDSIGKAVGTKDKSWLFYVNGKLGEKGADQTILSSGDLVEWKYQSF